MGGMSNQSNNNGSLQMGGNDISSVLSAIHQNASGMNNNTSSGGLGVGDTDGYQQQQQQQSAQRARFSDSMNNSASTIISGNVNVNNHGLGQFNGFTNNSSNAGQNSFSMLAQQQQGGQQQQTRQQQQQQMGQQQQRFQGGFHEETYNMSIPLKASSTSNFESPMESVHENARAVNRRAPRGAGRLDSSFTRAQRIGLKNSFTQNRRPPRNLTNAEMHNSLMSIESLTLDDIGDDFSGPVTDVFDDSEKKLGIVKHGNGPHDMSEVSFEGK